MNRRFTREECEADAPRACAHGLPTCVICAIESGYPREFWAARDAAESMRNPVAREGREETSR